MLLIHRVAEVALRAKENDRSRQRNLYTLGDSEENSLAGEEQEGGGGLGADTVHLDFFVLFVQGGPGQ